MIRFQPFLITSLIVSTFCTAGLGDPDDSPVVLCKNTHRLLGNIRAAQRASIARRLEKKNEALAAFAKKVAAQKESGVRDDHLPYFLQNKVPNAPVLVLIHGIAESPKGMRQIAEQ